jgi:hypothetical protein
MATRKWIYKFNTLSNIQTQTTPAQKSKSKKESSDVHRLQVEGAAGAVDGAISRCT